MISLRWATAVGVGVALALATPAGAKTYHVNQNQLEKEAAATKACTAAARSGKKVTKAVRAECNGGLVIESLPCQSPYPAIKTFAVGKSFYLMEVGHRPEKTGTPAESQIAYVCSHRTLVGAPPP